MAFEFNAEKYKLASAHQKAWGKRLIEELDFKGSERILDLGCGDGALTTMLAHVVPTGMVLGIDASENMITTAKKNHQADNLRFELLDINQIDFTSEFDVVFSNATLHWIKDHKTLMRNVFKGLKDQGTVRFQFAGDGNCSNLFKVLKKVMDMDEYAGYFDRFDWPWYMPSIDEYRMLMEQTGFALTKVCPENADRYFTDAKEMIGWIDQPSIVPFLSSISAKDKKGFRDAVVEQMIERTIQDDGRCFETFRRLNVLARK